MCSRRVRENGKKGKIRAGERGGGGSRCYFFIHEKRTVFFLL